MRESGRRYQNTHPLLFVYRAMMAVYVPFNQAPRQTEEQVLDAARKLFRSVLFKVMFMAKPQCASKMNYSGWVHHKLVRLFETKGCAHMFVAGRPRLGRN